MSTLRPVMPAVVRWLAESAAAAPSADNSQPWCFEWDGGVLRGRLKARGGFPADAHATQVALGAAAETLSQAWQTLGGRPEACRLGRARDGCFAEIELAGTEQLPEGGWQEAWFQRHTQRAPYRPEPLPREVGEALARCAGEGISIRLFETDMRFILADWVRRASEVRFRTREVNEWFAASLRFGQGEGALDEGLHVSTLALPPGGVGLVRLMSDWRRLTFMNRLGAYKLFSRIEAANFTRAPLAVAFTSPGGIDGFAAGRVLQRTWLELTRHGLSAQPYYVVADLMHRLAAGRVPKDCEADAHALVRDIHSQLGAGEIVHCLLRVGVPQREHPVSGRLPVERLLCAHS